MKITPNKDLQASVVEQGTLTRKGGGATEASGDNEIDFTVDSGKKWILKSVEWSSSSLSVASVNRMRVEIAPDGTNFAEIFNTTSVPSDAKMAEAFGNHNIIIPAGGVVRVVTNVSTYISGSLSAFILVMESDT